MKEATGEVSMTVIVVVAVAIIGGILAIMWPRIKGTIENAWGNSGQSSCEASGGTWERDTNKCICKNIGGTNTAGK